jgi:cytochrome b involved in lipid metabolism
VAFIANQSAKSVNKLKISAHLFCHALSSEVSAMKTRSATAAARAAPNAKAPLDVPETVSSGDTGGVRSWALLLGWCVCSYVLYAALRTAATVIGGKMLPFMCVHTILGFLVAASAATLLALLLFGRAVGANAEIRATNTDAAVRWHEEEGKSVLVPTIGFAKKRGALPRYTLAQVAAHETRDDLWIVIDEKAYDITHLVASHPGGVGPLVAMAGKDCTDVFANYHAVKVYKYMLPRYLVGEVTDVVVWPHVADFRAVRQELLRRGLFETDYRYYAILWYAFIFYIV